jgi:hypothetical protein
MRGLGPEFIDITWCVGYCSCAVYTVLKAGMQECWWPNI